MKEALYRWLGRILTDDLEIEPLQGDASVRKYYRVKHKQQTLICMYDPDYCSYPSFQKHYLLMMQYGIMLPKIEAMNANLQVYLLSDLGNVHLINEFTKPNIEKSILELIKINNVNYNQNISFKDKVIQQNNLFFDYFNIAESYKNFFNIFCSDEMFKYRNCYTHFDYHAENIMINKNQTLCIDFQDSCVGPIGYDLASLLRDRYDYIDNYEYESYVRFYYFNSNLQKYINYENFLKQVLVCGIQRNIKVLGLFESFAFNGREKYLDYIPMIINNLTNNAVLLKNAEIDKLVNKLTL